MGKGSFSTDHAQGFQGNGKGPACTPQPIDISPYDLRIRKWRENSLALFEQAWAAANRIGISMDESMASAVYVHCLVKVIDSEGHTVPRDIAPKGKDVAWLFKDVL